MPISSKKVAGRKKSICGPSPESDESDGYYALWWLFARVKYDAAKRGPQGPVQCPEQLHRAAETLRDALEQCWRARYKSDDLARVLLSILRES